MSLTPLFEGSALTQMNGLPPGALDALLERVVALVDEPWDATVLPPGDDPSRRGTEFGDPARGYGLLSFRFDEAAGVIAIFSVTWVG